MSYKIKEKKGKKERTHMNERRIKKQRKGALTTFVGSSEA
jgi:hypothetical protein